MNDTPLTDFNSWVEDLEEKGQVELCKADFARDLERDRAVLVICVRSALEASGVNTTSDSDERLIERFAASIAAIVENARNQSEEKTNADPL